MTRYRYALESKERWNLPLDILRISTSFEYFQKEIYLPVDSYHTCYPFEIGLNFSVVARPLDTITMIKAKDVLW